LRASDFAIATACAIALWLLGRTALRLDVTPSVLVVSAGYLVALAGRRRAGDERPEVRVELFVFLSGLILVRVGESVWEMPRSEALRTGAAATVAVFAGLVAARDARAGAMAAVVAMGVALAAGPSARSATLLALCLLWLARVVGRCSGMFDGRSTFVAARWALWTAAALWAWRGATIGPLAMLIGLARAPGGLWREGRSDERTIDLAVFAGTWVIATSTRVWEHSPLLFL
jgi:hypothetical protein